MNMNVGVPFILQREIFLFSLPSPHLLSQGCRGEKSMFQSSSIYWHRWFFVFPFQSRQTKLKIISFQAIILGGGTKYESSNPRWILMSFQHISMGENDFLNLVVILTLHICIEILRFWAFSAIFGEFLHFHNWWPGAKTIWFQVFISTAKL